MNRKHGLFGQKDPFVCDQPVYYFFYTNILRLFIVTLI